MYKILTGLYDSEIAPTLIRNNDNRTRGNSIKLMHIRSRYDLRKFSFCSRVVGVWNTLPNNVINASSVNIFKNRLDKFWCGEEMYFDINANLIEMFIV